jgi:polyribonucleotide nucleotidyltransferase
LSFVTKNGLYLAFNDEDMAVGTTTMNTNATWLVTRMEKVSTAIEEIVTEENNGEFYDLQGRKIQNPGKGVYIKNGKKIIIK